MLQKECGKNICLKLVTYIEKKSDLRKLKQTFQLQQAQTESRNVNDLFLVDPGSDYERFNEVIKIDQGNMRPFYKVVNNA